MNVKSLISCLRMIASPRCHLAQRKMHGSAAINDMCGRFSRE